MAAQGKISLKTPLLELAFTKVPESEANYAWLKPAVRALLGDVAEDIKSVDGTQTVSIKYIKNCANRLNASLAEALMTGEYTGGSLHGASGAYGNQLTCTDYSGADGGFIDYVSDTLVSIRDKIKAGTVPNAAEIAFINSTRVPIYALFSKAVIAGKVTGDTSDTLTDGFISSLEWPLATDITINTLEHLSSFFAAISTEMMTQEVVADSGSTALKETIKIWQDTLNEELQKGYEMQKAAWSTAETNLGDLQQRYQELQRVIYTKLAENKLMDSYVWARGSR